MKLCDKETPSAWSSVKPLRVDVNGETAGYILNFHLWATGSGHGGWLPPLRPVHSAGIDYGRDGQGRSH